MRIEEVGSMESDDGIKLAISSFHLLFFEGRECIGMCGGRGGLEFNKQIKEMNIDFELKL